jgi:hypothetical protein
VVGERLYRTSACDFVQSWRGIQWHWANTAVDVRRVQYRPSQKEFVFACPIQRHFCMFLRVLVDTFPLREMSFCPLFLRRKLSFSYILCVYRSRRLCVKGHFSAQVVVIQTRSQLRKFRVPKKLMASFYRIWVTLLEKYNKFPKKHVSCWIYRARKLLKLGVRKCPTRRLNFKNLSKILLYFDCLANQQRAEVFTCL